VRAGITKIFTAVSLKATHIFQVEMNSVHIDGSSMSVQGEYETKEKSSERIEGEAQEVEPEMKAIEIVHGYSRDTQTRSETIYH
jgi:hypothetical protein